MACADRRIYPAGWLTARPGAGFATDRTRLAALLLGLLTLLAACATPVQRPQALPALAGHVVPTVADVNLLAISPEMKAFADRYARPGPDESPKAWKLAYASLDPYLLDFDYDPMLTLPADEAFRVRRGNCLTFSSLFVAMARSAGLEAWYQEVQLPPEWSAVNETLLLSKHVNAVVREHGQKYVIDVSRRRPEPNEQTRRLSDREATAQYYNNLGVDALVGGDLGLAYAYFAKALEVHPGLAYLWSNLGVVYRRNGQPADAILAYRAALEDDPEHTVALSNLHALYTETGDLAAAAELKQRVERNQRNNPYYLHHLAELANEEQRWPDAIELLERAIKLEPDEYRFYYTLAHAQYHAGQIEVARSSLERARQLAAAQPSVGTLTLPDGS